MGSLGLEDYNMRLALFLFFGESFVRVDSLGFVVVLASLWKLLIQNMINTVPMKAIKLRRGPIWPCGKQRMVNTKNGVFQRARVEAEGWKVPELKGTVAPSHDQWKVWAWALRRDCLGGCKAASVPSLTWLCCYH